MPSGSIALSPQSTISSPLQEFLDNHPHPGWRIALLTNLGLSYFNYGYFAETISSFETAWEEGKAITDLRGRSLVDRVVGNLPESTCA